MMIFINMMIIKIIIALYSDIITAWYANDPAMNSEVDFCFYAENHRCTKNDKDSHPKSAFLSEI